MHPPALLAVIPQGIEDFIQLLPGIRGDRFNKGFHPAFQISAQQIAGADEKPLIRAVAEAVDTGVLQPAAHDAGDRNVLREPGNPRTETADSPHKELDLYAGLGAFDQLLHDIQVVDGVHFHGNPAVFPPGDFLIQELEHTGLKSQGSESEMMHLRRNFSIDEGGKSGFRIQADILPGRNQGQVCILLTGDLIIISGADLRDPADDTVMQP